MKRKVNIVEDLEGNKIFMRKLILEIDYVWYN